MLVAGKKSVLVLDAARCQQHLMMAIDGLLHPGIKLVSVQQLTDGETEEFQMRIR